jgi:hypothetical protein
LSRVNGKEKIFFGVDGTRSEHRELAGKLRQSDDLRNFETIAGYESE